jgi:tetratricopeptide (TPR) repeat protein
VDPTSADAPITRRRVVLAVTVLAAVLACAVYANALRNGYAIDDEYIVLRNPTVHDFRHNLHQLLLGSYWPNSVELYRPVTIFAFALNWAATGSSAAWMHAVNALLHALATVLVIRLVLRLGGGLWAAAGAAAVFAVHPVHVEAVAWLVGRAEILATIFVLLACLLFLAERPPPALKIAGIAALYIIGLGAKESAVTLPALLLLLDALRTRGERIPAWRLLVRNLPLLAVLTVILGVFLALRHAALGLTVGTAPAPYLRGLPVSVRLATAVRLWPEYLRLLLWPRDLSAEWGPDVIVPVGWGSPLTWLGMACGVGLAGVAWLSWRRDRWIAAAILWCAITIFPVSHIPFFVGVMIAERTFYLVTVGLAFLFPPLVQALARERPPARYAAVAALALLVGLGAWRTWIRNPVWKSSTTVFDSMVDEHPNLWWVEWKAGQILARAGRGEEAIPWYRQAVEKTRYNHYNMLMDFASSLIGMGRRADAHQILHRGMVLAPNAVPAFVIDCSLMIDEARYRAALARCQQGLRVPRFGPLERGEIADRMAIVYDALGRPDSAMPERRISLRDPTIARTFEAWFHYARLLKLAGQDRQALAALDSARARVAPQLRANLKLDPLPKVTDPTVKGWTGLVVQPQPALGAATFRGVAPEPAPTRPGP